MKQPLVHFSCLGDNSKRKKLTIKGSLWLMFESLCITRQNKRIVAPHALELIPPTHQDSSTCEHRLCQNPSPAYHVMHAIFYALLGVVVILILGPVSQHPHMHSHHLAAVLATFTSHNPEHEAVPSLIETDFPETLRRKHTNPRNITLRAQTQHRSRTRHHPIINNPCSR